MVRVGSPRRGWMLVHAFDGDRDCRRDAVARPLMRFSESVALACFRLAVLIGGGVGLARIQARSRAVLDPDDVDWNQLLKNESVYLWQPDGRLRASSLF